MKKTSICLILIFSVFATLAQLEETFTDGNLWENPTWLCDTNNFMVNEDLMLQLNASVAGSSNLSTENLLCDSTEWIFSVQQKFAPSSNNYAYVWLMADNSILTEANGYYLQLGESGSADLPELFCHNNGISTSVCRCTGPNIAISFSHTFKITRSELGNWNVYFRDDAGGYALAGTGKDNTIVTTQYFGISCQYTSSNIKSFYFDDIYIQHIYHDIDPPEGYMAIPSSSNTVIIEFSEPLNNEEASNVQNYFLTPPSIHPVAAGLDIENPSLVNLLFDTPFSEDTTYFIAIEGITDLCGNIMEPLYLHFVYNKIHPGDLVITEVMADINPSPPEIPPFEYLELTNISTNEIQLKDFYLKINTTYKTIDNEYNITPGERIIICDEAWDFEGSKITFSSISIPNEEAQISIYSKSGEIIHCVNYQRSWHNNSEKSEGGWSLEIIDPLNYCTGQGNWLSSEDAKGGTPGERNSVTDDNPDFVSPKMLYASLPYPDTVLIYFSETINHEILSCKENFVAFPTSITIIAIAPVLPECRCAKITLSEPLSENTLLGITNILPLYDCWGNMSDTDTVYVAIALLPEPGDIVINEVLFNPEPEFADYAEILNTSQHTIDISDIVFSLFDTITQRAYDYMAPFSESRLLFPGQYLLITEDTTGMAERYDLSNTKALLATKGLPSMPNETGSLALVRFQDDKIIDAMVYDESMHYPLLYNNEGVSLEKISPAGKGTQKELWQSASEQKRFGTPGYKNSCLVSFPESDSELTVSPGVITPDNDGVDDVAAITLQLFQPEGTADILIIDPRGYLIRTLEENLQTGSKNELFWNGTDDGGRLVSAGLYVIVISLNSENGRGKVIKTVVGVGL